MPLSVNCLSGAEDIAWTINCAYEYGGFESSLGLPPPPLEDSLFGSIGVLSFSSCLMLLLFVRLFVVAAAFRAAIWASDMKLGRWVPPLGDVGQEFAALKTRKITVNVLIWIMLSMYFNFFYPYVI